MKKSIFYLLTIWTVSLFTACNTSDVDEVFDQSASQRLNAKATECMNLLTSAPNGWMIAYYPEENQSYGGFVYLAKFDKNGEVTVSGEIANSDERVTSHYSILYTNSVVLSFDTYNLLFHYFADPDYDNGDSYEGDFEFAYVSGDADEMVFRGTKTDNTIVFTALDEGQDWVEYLDGVAAMDHAIVVSPYCGLTSTGNQTEFTFGTLRTLTYAPDPARPAATVDVAFCYIPDGMMLYEPIEVEGTEVQRFVWDAANGCFKSTDAETTVTLAGATSDQYVPYDFYLGNWILDYYSGSVPVTISADEEGLSYILSGLAVDLELSYDKMTGILSWTTQYVGQTANGYYVYACPWDASTGYYTWGENYGLDLIYNRDEANPVISFEDNGRWGSYEVNSILVRLFRSASPGSSTSVGNYAQIVFLDKLHK